MAQSLLVLCIEAVAENQWRFARLDGLPGELREKIDKCRVRPNSTCAPIHALFHPSTQALAVPMQVDEFFPPRLVPTRKQMRH